MIMKRSNNRIGTGGAIDFQEITTEPWVRSQLAMCERKVGEQLLKTNIPRIPPSNIVKIVSVLGKGSFSKVYKVKVQHSLLALSDDCDCTNGKPITKTTRSSNKHVYAFYALKCLNPKRMTSEGVFEVASTDLAYEVSILCQLDHENIIRLIGVTSEEFAITFTSGVPSKSSSSSSGVYRCGYYMLLEVLKETLECRLQRWRKYMKWSLVANPCGQKNHEQCQVTKRRRIPSSMTTTELWQAIEYENRISNVMQGLAEAIRYLHHKGIVVRDVKPDNVGFSSDGVVKLFDFGFARRIEDCQDGEIVGSLRYMAPENMTGRKSDVTSDVYSFGVLLWEVATLHKPYDEILPNLSSQRTTSIRAQFARKLSIQDGGEGWRHSIEDVSCAKTRALIQRCWNPHPKSRPEFDSICLELGEISNDIATSSSDLAKELSQTRSMKRGGERSSSFPLLRRVHRTFSRTRLIRQRSAPETMFESRTGTKSLTRSVVMLSKDVSRTSTHITCSITDESIPSVHEEK